MKHNHYINMIEKIDLKVNLYSPKESGKLLNKLWKTRWKVFCWGYESASPSEKTVEKFLHLFLNQTIELIFSELVNVLMRMDEQKRKSFLWFFAQHANKGVQESERYYVHEFAYMLEGAGIMPSIDAYGLLMHRHWDNLFNGE